MFDFLTFIPRAIMQGIPLLFGSTGETLTEKSGNLNLGIPGIMYVGAISGVIGSFYYESSVSPEAFNGFLAVLITLFSVPMLTLRPPQIFVISRASLGSSAMMGLAPMASKALATSFTVT